MEKPSRMAIKRRQFLQRATTASAAVAATTLAAPAIAQQRMEWKMVTSWPKGLAGLSTGAERLAQRIGDISGGQLTVKVYAAGGFYTAVPFGMNAQELNGWVYYGGGQELWDELYAPFGVKGLLAGNTGEQMGGWFRKEIKSPADLKGLKFRMPGQGGEVLTRLGVTVVTLPGGEIFQNLQSGAIDGTEWVGPYNDL